MPHEIQQTHEISEAGDGRRQQQRTIRTQEYDYGTVSHGTSGPALLSGSPFGATTDAHAPVSRDHDVARSGEENQNSKDPYQAYYEERGQEIIASTQQQIRDGEEQILKLTCNSLVHAEQRHIYDTTVITNLFPFIKSATDANICISHLNHHFCNTDTPSSSRDISRATKIVNLIERHKSERGWE